MPGGDISVFAGFGPKGDPLLKVQQMWLSPLHEEFEFGPIGLSGVSTGQSNTAPKIGLPVTFVSQD
jgi:hypothetical protein